MYGFRTTIVQVLRFKFTIINNILLIDCPIMSHSLEITFNSLTFCKFTFVKIHFLIKLKFTYKSKKLHKFLTIITIYMINKYLNILFI